MGNALKGLCVLLIALQSCKQHSDENLLTSYAAKTTEGSVNAVIEIPSGTRQKWEINKKTGVLEWEQVAGKGRIVEYLGYPGNYGFIPKTLLPKALYFKCSCKLGLCSLCQFSFLPTSFDDLIILSSISKT